MKDLDYMGMVYIAEETNTGVESVKSLDVTEKGSVFFVSFDTNLHSFDIINRNGRSYLGDNVMDVIEHTEKIQSLLAGNEWFGEQNHPIQVHKDRPLTPERLREIWLPNRSHKIMRPKRCGNLLQAHIETSSGTDVGRGFACDIIQGLVPRFSCRAIAILKYINGKPVVIIKQLITYDWVLYPSHKEAEAITKPKAISKATNVYTESAVDTKPNIGDTMIPLHEILGYISAKDVPTNVIMESFDLGPESLVGVDKTHTHAIMKDDTNMIYININPETKKEVDNFFASF